MAFNANIPYNDLPPLPPKADVETKVILKKTIAARSALAELKGLGGTIPNQALLVDSLILQEAKASSPPVTRCSKPLPRRQNKPIRQQKKSSVTGRPCGRDTTT
jgi:hypothetical protein